MSPSNIVYLLLLKSAITNFGLTFYLNSNIRCDMCKQHEQLTAIVMLLMDSQQTLFKPQISDITTTLGMAVMIQQLQHSVKQ